MKASLPFVYSIRRSGRAKKTRIIVSAEKIEVVTPLRVSEKKIHAFVRSQQDWIVGATEKVLKQSQAIKKINPDVYTDGVVIQYKGQKTTVWVKQSDSDESQIECNKQGITLYISSQSVINSDLNRQVLMEWLKKQALKSVEEYVEIHALKNNLFPRSVKIKTQKSRWGSCGINNDIHINWLLIFAPPQVLEYVVVHELCHLKQRNHSARFWRLVEICLPEYKQFRNWLKKNGNSLMLGL